jgi:hypothetical protein
VRPHTAHAPPQSYHPAVPSTGPAEVVQNGSASLYPHVPAIAYSVLEGDFDGLTEEWLRWFPSNPPACQGAKFLTLALVEEKQR